MISGWHKVNKEQAIRFVNHLLKGITTMNGSEKIKYINEERIKGVTVKDLMDRERYEKYQNDIHTKRKGEN